MIMRVIAMTPDQINMLPPTERASIIQLVKNISLISLDLIVLILIEPVLQHALQRATLGLPS